MSAPQVYGGDEVGAVVLDPGSYNFRAGYAGEDIPRYVVPSFYGISNDVMDVDVDLDKDSSTGNKTYKDFKRRDKTYFGSEQLRYPRANVEVRSIVSDEIIEDWEAAVEMFDFMFQEMGVDIEEQPVLLTEPVWNTKKNKLKSLEVFLEFFHTPAFYLVKAPACTAFAAGRPNSLIVQLGHDITSVTPVLDGMCLSSNTMKTHYAGRFIDSQLRSSLTQRKIEIVPKFKVKSKSPVKYSLKQFENGEPLPQDFWESKSDLPQVTKSFENYETQCILNEIKESAIVVSETPITDTDKFDYQSRYFELANGLQVEFEKERYEIGNSLFDPSSYINFWKKHPQYHFDDDLEWTEENGEMAELDINNNYVPLKRGKKRDENEKVDEDLNGGNSKVRGLSSLIHQTIANLDVDIRQQVAHNIVVTGALSLVPGLTDRVYKDLNEMNPGLKIRIHASGNSQERKYQNWVGGSIIASLGTFHQLWVSKSEYEEIGGERLITERFR